MVPLLVRLFDANGELTAGHACTGQDDNISQDDLNALLDAFPEQPLDFFGAIRCTDHARSNALCRSRVAVRPAGAWRQTWLAPKAK